MESNFNWNDYNNNQENNIFQIISPQKKNLILNLKNKTKRSHCDISLLQISKIQNSAIDNKTKNNKDNKKFEKNDKPIEIIDNDDDVVIDSNNNNNSSNNNNSNNNDIPLIIIDDDDDDIIQDNNGNGNGNNNLTTYMEKELNLNINGKRNILKIYNFFPNLETLILNVGDLRYIKLLEFPNLKKLHIEKLIKYSKPIKPIKPILLKQLSLEFFSSKSNRQKILKQQIERDKQKTISKGQSGKKNIFVMNTNNNNITKKDNKKKIIYHLITNELTTLLMKTTNIETLCLRDYDLENIPPVIWNLQKLKYLVLKRLEITEISDKIENLINLEKLDLSNTKIESLPDSFSQLKNLKVLTIVGIHSFKTWPNVLEKLPNLRELNIDESQAELWEKPLQELLNTNENLVIDIW